ncbi:MAG: hypothetical protein ACREL1_04305 [bacterium]
MKRFVAFGILAALLALPLVLGLACKSNGSGDLPTGLKTIEAANPTYTFTPTATATSTPCTGTFGTPTPGMDSLTDASNMYLNQYTAAASTTLTTLTVWTAGGGTAEAGIYNDTGSDAPASLLGETGVQTAVDGANVYPIQTSVVINNGTNYWLAVHSNAAMDSGPAANLTFTSPVGSSFLGLPVSVDGGTYLANSASATLLSVHGTTCP